MPNLMRIKKSYSLILVQLPSSAFFDLAYMIISSIQVEQHLSLLYFHNNEKLDDCSLYRILEELFVLNVCSI